MGGAFAQNLLAAGWRVVGYDTDRSAARARARRRDRRQCRGGRAARPIIITSLPSPGARIDTVAAIAARSCRAGSSSRCSTFTLDDKDKAEKRAAQGRPRHARLSGERHRLAGARPDLVVYASGDRKPIGEGAPVFAASPAAYDLGAFGNGSRMKYVANLLVAINNVASAEAMVLGMKAGLDPQADLRDDLQRRRQFARVRAARADDGEERLQRRHHEMLGLAEGHGRDRRLRQEDAACRRRCFRRRCRSMPRRSKAATPMTTPPRSAPCWRRKPGQAPQVALRAAALKIFSPSSLPAP